MKNKATISLFAILTLGPFCMGFLYSLLYSFGLVGWMSQGFTLDHWGVLFGNPAALLSMGYTLVLSLVSILFALVIALGIAWQFLIRQKHSRILPFIFLPMLMAPLIAGFAWYYMLSPTGFLARFLYHLGLLQRWEDFPRMVNDAFSLGIITTHVFLVFPIFTLLFIALLQKENLQGLLEQSTQLGASKWIFVRTIFVPILLWKSRPILWLYGVFLMGTYEVPLILGRSTPQVLSIFISEKLTRFDLSTIPVAHAMAVVYSLLVVLIITLFVRKKALQIF